MDTKLELKESNDPHALGQPLTIKEASLLVGLSPWTIRHVLIPAGLPHFRSGASGKLVFYQSQLVRWILNHQFKGGTKR